MSSYQSAVQFPSLGSRCRPSDEIYHKSVIHKSNP